MNKIIDFFVTSFVLDFLITLSLKKTHELSVKFWEVLLLQILNIVGSVVFIFCKLEFYQYLLTKIALNFVICLLITEEYSACKIFVLFGNYILNLFAIYGASMFLTEFFRAVIVDLFNIKIPEIYNLSLFFAQILFVFAIFGITRGIIKEKRLRQFMSKVSFCVNGKHIEVTGLLDSGNSLYDTKSGNAVIVVSTNALKQVLTKSEYLRFMQGENDIIGITDKVSYVCVGGKKSEMPIISDVCVTIKHSSETQKHKCSIGFINQKFGENKFECLVHKDFV